VSGWKPWRDNPNIWADPNTNPKTMAGKRLDGALDEAYGENADVSRAIVQIEREEAKARIATWDTLADVILAVSVLILGLSSLLLVIVVMLMAWTAW
jgi:hypothetical protein